MELRQVRAVLSSEGVSVTRWTTNGREDAMISMRLAVRSDASGSCQTVVVKQPTMSNLKILGGRGGFGVPSHRYFLFAQSLAFCVGGCPSFHSDLGEGKP